MSRKHVKELRRARKRIESGEEAYICDALRNKTPDLVYRWVKDSPWTEAAGQIVEQIRMDLGGRFSLYDWLNDKGHELPFSSIAAYDELRATRLAWIDALIEYWKDKP